MLWKPVRKSSSEDVPYSVNPVRACLCTIAWALIYALFFCPANASAGDENAWENQRRSNARQETESVKRIIENRRDKLIASLPPLQRKQLEGVEVIIDIDPYYPFVFEARVFFDDNGNRRRQLFTTVETIATIFKVTGAAALPILDTSLGDSWLRDYLLYMRKTPNGVPIIDPLRASGLVNASGSLRPGISREAFINWEADSKAVADTILMFLVAHEMAHFSNWLSPRQITESDKEFGRRQRASEAEADRFGLSMLLDIERSSAGQSEVDRPQLYAKGAPIIFLWWVLSMEGSHHPITAETHPLDHVRAIATSEIIVNNINSLGSTAKDRELIICAARELRKEMDEIERNGKKFFDDLDKEASRIALETLSSRKTSIPSQHEGCKVQ